MTLHRIFRSAAILSGAAMLTLTGAAASAAQCRDAHGKFIECATVKPAPAGASGRCRDGHGKFVKCVAPKAH